MPDDLDRLREQAEQELDPDFHADGWFGPRAVTREETPRGEVLRFSIDDDTTRRLFPTRGLLRAFTRLRNADGRAIERFAKAWGRLYLCDHGLPSSHHAFAPHERGPASLELSEEDEDAFWEDIVRFRPNDAPVDDEEPEPFQHPARIGLALRRPSGPLREDIGDEGWATYEPVAAW